MLRGGTTSYYQADGLGSITSLTDGSGSLAATYSYDSFGKLVASTGTLVNPFRYTGRELDSETGLYYYRARYYDPQIGRFISDDPLRFGAGYNFYTYTENSPVNATDPSGLESKCSTAPCIPRSYLPLKVRLALRLMSMASRASGVTYFFGLQGSVTRTRMASTGYGIAGASYGFSGVWAADPQGNVAIVYSLSAAGTLGTPGGALGAQVGAASYQSLYDGFPGSSFGREISGGRTLNVGVGYATNSSGVATYTNIGFAGGKNLNVNISTISSGVLIVPLCKE